MPGLDAGRLELRGSPANAGRNTGGRSIEAAPVAGCLDELSPVARRANDGFAVAQDHSGYDGDTLRRESLRLLAQSQHGAATPADEGTAASDDDRLLVAQALGAIEAIGVGRGAGLACIQPARLVDAQGNQRGTGHVHSKS